MSTQSDDAARADTAGHPDTAGAPDPSGHAESAGPADDATEVDEIARHDDAGRGVPDVPSTADATYQTVRNEHHGTDPERGRSFVRRMIDKVVGNPKGDRTEPHPVRGWEGPADEQIAEPGDGPGETHPST